MNKSYFDIRIIFHNNEMEDNQILSKITLGNYISENGKDWEGIDKVITAMEETRKSLLKKEK